jgi:hypothetical protein
MGVRTRLGLAATLGLLGTRPCHRRIGRRRGRRYRRRCPGHVLASCDWRVRWHSLGSRVLTRDGSLATAAGRLISEAEAARPEFEGRTAILRFMRSALGDEARCRVDVVSAWPTDYDVRSNPLLETWKAAADALSRDADALLPDA